MPYIAAGAENTGTSEIYDEDHGSGVPAVLSHGYPLNSRAWEKQVPALLHDVHHVIKDGLHAIAWTHPEEVNAALLEFLK